MATEVLFDIGINLKTSRTSIKSFYLIVAKPKTDYSYLQPSDSELYTSSLVSLLNTVRTLIPLILLS